MKNIILRSWRHHFWTNAATTTVLTLSFLVISALWLGSRNVSSLMTRWGENIQLTVYLKDEAGPEAIKSLEEILKSKSSVDQVQIVGKQQASEIFRQSLASYGPSFLKALEEGAESPFPASIYVSFKPELRTASNIEEVAKSVATLESVEDVSYGEDWLSNYNTLHKIVTIVTWVLGLALSAGTLFTISNSIRASLAARREEIAILELVGATESSIRKPFVVEGAFQGFVASTFSLVLLGVCYVVLTNALGRNAATALAAQSVEFFPWYLSILVVLIGTLLGGLGSYICVAQINTGWAAREEA